MKTNCLKLTNYNSTNLEDSGDTPLLLHRTIWDQQENDAHILKKFNSTNQQVSGNTPLLLPQTISDQQENDAHILKNFEDKLLKMDKLQFNKSTGFWRHPPNIASDTIRSTGKWSTHMTFFWRQIAQNVQIAIQQNQQISATPPFFCLGQ